MKSQYPDVKIIAVSGGGSWSPGGMTFGVDNPLEMARRFGAVRTLKKPVKLQKLLEIVSALMETETNDSTKFAEENDG